MTLVFGSGLFPIVNIFSLVFSQTHLLVFYFIDVYTYTYTHLNDAHCL